MSLYQHLFSSLNFQLRPHQTHKFSETKEHTQTDEQCSSMGECCSYEHFQPASLQNAQIMWFMFSSCVSDDVVAISWCKRKALEGSAWIWVDRANVWINNLNYRVLQNRVKVMYAKEDIKQVLEETGKGMMEEWDLLLSSSSPHCL